MTKLTALDLEPYAKAISEKICVFCNDRDGHGGCARPPEDPCVLQSHLDLVVDSVLAVGEKPDIEPYAAALREKTCPYCRQDEKGRCVLRELGQCASDSYLLPLVEVIEDVARRLGHGKWAKPSA